MKPPAFQCYADDLLAGTADMTAEEFGVYWRLVCHSWNKNGLPNDDYRLGLLAGQCQASAVALAKTKFVLGEDGLLRNPRLEKIRSEQVLYRQMQSEKAHLSWEKRRARQSDGPPSGGGLANGSAMPVHMPVHKPEICSPSPSPTPFQQQEREQPFPEANVPSWEEVKRMAEMHNITEAVARAFYDHNDSLNLWRNRHGVMTNVLNRLKIWDNNERQGKPNGNHNGHRARPGVDRNAGTANAGKAHLYGAGEERV